MIAGASIPFIVGTTAGIALGWGVYQACQWADHKFDNVETESLEDIASKDEKKGRRRGKDNEIKDGPPRDLDTGNYLPDPLAENTPHTTLGIRKGNDRSYTQGATFDENGEFKGRTDLTDHGRHDHPYPHYHPATGPNSAKTRPQPIDFFNGII